MAPPVLAIGVFDGVHAGHRQLIATAERLAGERGAPCAVFTFIEHPRTVLRPDNPVPLLTPWPEKRELLRELALDACIATHFTPDLAALTPEDFVSRILVDQLHVQAVVTGFNFAFGHRQSGDSEVLTSLGRQYDFEVAIVPPFVSAGALDVGLVSSSRLRELLATGRVAEANALLCRPYTLSGQVIHGDKRGRTIGFPTANMHLPADKLLPAYGVYACWVTLNGERLPGIVNIGQRPTFDPPKLMVEAHLLDWQGEIYGETIAVSLIARIRSEIAFPSVAALVNQIGEDCQVARKLLVLVHK